MEETPISLTTPAIHSVVSADGTAIGFERLGAGPVLVLVQGAMGTAYTFRELSQALADSFTVIVPDRRGRGMSSRRFDHGYTVADDVADLDAVLRATGGRFVFGLSSGGDIVLEAALTLPRIERLAVCEPAILLDGIPAKGFERFNAYVEADDLPGILVAGMKLSRQGPAIMRAMPDWLVKPAIKRIIKAEEKTDAGDDAPMAELAQALPYDLAIAHSIDGGSISKFADLKQPVLLLGGSKSPHFLKRALDELEQMIPDATRLEIAGVDHAAAWNVDRRRNPHGNPTAVAEVLKTYFSSVTSGPIARKVISSRDEQS
ncbi:MAG TPA: alpha/beta hydrolase [Gaiellaceae bacterium]|nr:alpha/beta hydrolase [Gaiellaceae bacterium]